PPVEIARRAGLLRRPQARRVEAARAAGLATAHPQPAREACDGDAEGGAPDAASRGHALRTRSGRRPRGISRASPAAGGELRAAAAQLLSWRRTRGTVARDAFGDG